MMIRCDFVVSKKIMSIEEFMSKQLMEEDAKRQQQAIETMKKITQHKNLGAFKAVPTSDEIEEARKNRFFKPKTESEAMKEASTIAATTENPSDQEGKEIAAEKTDDLPEKEGQEESINEQPKNDGSESNGDITKESNDNSDLESEVDSELEKSPAEDKNEEIQQARKTMEVTADYGVNGPFLSERINYDFNRKFDEGELTSRVKKVNYSNEGSLKGRVLEERLERLLILDSPRRNLYFDIEMKCEYISEDNSNSLRYKSQTKLTCDSKRTPIMNFILVDSIISNQETVNLRKMMRYKRKDKGHYIAYIADRDFYPKIQTISDKCSFIIESTTFIAKATSALIATILFLVN